MKAPHLPYVTKISLLNKKQAIFCILLGFSWMVNGQETTTADPTASTSVDSSAMAADSTASTTDSSLAVQFYTWTWRGSAQGFWNTASNWTSGTTPVGNNSTILNFNTATTSSINNIQTTTGTFLLNRLNFGSSIGNYSISGNALQFSGTSPLIRNLNTTGTVSIANNIVFSANTTFSQSSGSSSVFSGVLSGSGNLTVAGGTVQLRNASNGFSGGLTIGSGTVKVSEATAINIGSSGSSSYLGTGSVSATGGNLIVETTGAHDLTVSRSMSFSSASAVGSNANVFSSGQSLTVNPASLSITNGAQLNLISNNNLTFSPTHTTIDTGGILSIQNLVGTSDLYNAPITFGSGGGTLSLSVKSGLSNGIGPIAINTTGTNQAVIRNNLMSNDSASQGWIHYSTDDYFLNIADNTLSGTGNVTFEMLNGSNMAYGQTSFGGTVTFKGVSGGSAAANSASANVGRFSIQNITATITGGLFLQNANQIVNIYGPATLNTNITVQSGETAFQGRATSLGASGDSRFTIGGSSANTLTINQGATATFDRGFRTDSFATQISGIILNASTLINGGGTLQFTQTANNSFSTYDTIQVLAPITGQGSATTGEALLKIQDSIVVGSQLIFGSNVNLYVQGSDIYGLRVEGSASNVNALLTSKFLQSNVQSTSSATSDQGTLTIAYTDNGTRTFTNEDAPTNYSYIRLGFDAGTNATPTYVLSQTGSGGNLSHWNGLVIKGGTVQLATEVTFVGANKDASFTLAGGTLDLQGTSKIGNQATFYGNADLRAGTIQGTGSNAGVTVYGNATKTTSGTVYLNGRLTILGSSGLNIQAGTLSQSFSDALTSTTNLTLSGGTYQLTGGADQTLGTLTLMADSYIDFSNGSSILQFADSSNAIWSSGATLWITNWQGNMIEGGGSSQLIFGGLTDAQLSQIKFVNPAGWTGTYSAMRKVGGEVVPVPEASTLWAGFFLMLGVIQYEIKRRRVLKAKA